MIVLLLFSFSLYIVYLLNKKAAAFSIIYAAIVVLIHFLYTIEFHYGDIDYFISDEAVFMQLDNAHVLTEIAKGDRILWYKFLEITKWYDFTDGMFSKLSSIVFLPILVYFLHRLEPKNNLNYYCLFFVPYLLYVSQTALRDIFILTMTLSLIYSLVNLKKNIIIFSTLILFSTLLILMLRPFLLGVIFSTYVLTRYIVSLRGENINLKIFRTFIFISFFTILSVLFYILLKDKIDQYIRTLVYIQENGLSLDADKTEIKPDFSIQYFLYSVFRYAMTPIPTSLVERLFTGVTKFGYIDDLFRFFNQTILYAMYFYILVNLNFLKIALKSIRNEMYSFHFLIFSIVNTVVYSLYYAGGGHSRLKLVYYIFIFLIFSKIYNIKRFGK